MMKKEIIVFLTSFGASLLSSMSGGGSPAISLPIFLSLGISFPLATAMQKVSAVFWAPTAAWNYLKGRTVDWTFVVLFAALGLIGSYLGVQVVLAINERILELVVGLIILLLVTYTLFEKKLGMKETKPTSNLQRRSAYIFALILGFYESIFGAGNGILFAIVSVKTRGFDFIDALGYYFVIAFFWVLFAAALLFRQGIYDVPLMASAILSSIAGAYIGSSFARLKGNAFIKAIFVIIGSLLGAKLIFNL